MSNGEILFMVLVVAVAVVMAFLKGKVPAVLGFILMLAASLAAIIGGAVTKGYKVIPMGVAGIIGTIVAWVTGATSRPATNPDLPDDGSSSRIDAADTLGGVARNIRWWAWLIIAALVVGAVAVAVVIP